MENKFAYKINGTIYFNELKRVKLLNQECTIIKYDIDNKILFAIKNFESNETQKLEELQKDRFNVIYKIKDISEIELINYEIYDFFENEYPDFFI